MAYEGRVIGTTSDLTRTSRAHDGDWFWKEFEMIH